MGSCCSKKRVSVIDAKKPVSRVNSTWGNVYPDNSTWGNAYSGVESNVDSHATTESLSFSNERSLASTVTGSLSIDSTPLHIARKPSPSRHILAGAHKGSIGDSLESDEYMKLLDKNFGFPRDFASKYDLGLEVGRGHFGHTCCATAKFGELKGQVVAVKVILKAEMTSEREIEDVRREVAILRTLRGSANVVQFYEAYEDHNRVCVVMELCTGGELLDHILSRGGRFMENEAKEITVQMLIAVSSVHLQGVVHRDLKPENFLFTGHDGSYDMKLIDFGLSDFVHPDDRLTDIVGSAYYVAPEVLEQSYDTQADVWSVGVIAYILLSGNRPFWAQTESGIFHEVTQTEPDYEEPPWPSISLEATDFVKKLLAKDPRRRMTAAQALAHPWVRGDHNIPLDVLTLKMVKSYLDSSLIQQSALKALAKVRNEEDFYFLHAQFMLLKPDLQGLVTLEKFKMVLLETATEATPVWNILKVMSASLQNKVNFHEFCAAAMNIHQLEMSENWESDLWRAYQHFEKNGNRQVSVEELMEATQAGTTVSAITFFSEWIRMEDGRLSFTGFINLLFT